MRVALDSSVFQDFAALSDSLKGKRVCPALGALAMGDNLAVEIANSAHEGVLKREVGSLRADEHVISRLALSTSRTLAGEIQRTRADT